MPAFSWIKTPFRPQKKHSKSATCSHSALSSLAPQTPWAQPSPTYQIPLHAITSSAALNLTVPREQHHIPLLQQTICLLHFQPHHIFISNTSTLYPEIQKTEVWITPNQHNCTNTISEIQASSNSHLQAVMTYNPYSNTQPNQIPTPDSELPPRFLQTKQHPKGKPNHSHRPQASTSPQPYHNSWTKGPHIQPNNQPTISSITTESTPTKSAESKLLLNLQAEVAALTLRLGPNNPSPNEAILSAVTDSLNQSLSQLSALIEQHIHATLQSPSFSAAVTTTIRTELLSFQPPHSRTSQESGSKSE